MLGYKIYGSQKNAKFFSSLNSNSMKKTSIPKVDIAPESADIHFARLHHFRNRLRNRWLRLHGEKFWKGRELMGYQDVYRKITDSIQTQEPYAVGRLGGVEANLMMWGKRMPGFFWRPDSWTLFADTAAGAINAGIRPRNPESYRVFARLAWDALQEVDLLGVWKTGYESIILECGQPRSFFNGEIAGPNGENNAHWMRALKGRRVLVISPFTVTIQSQMPKLGKVWPEMPWLAETDFNLLPFPYLIDEGCRETWWEVYERIGKIVSAGNYDVALFGCGGLGLPFAQVAKDAGRVGIHLGGHLQLIFGIYGQRHLQQPWFRDQMNEYWVRPDKSEVPHSAKRVEGGCYW